MSRIGGAFERLLSGGQLETSGGNLSGVGDVVDHRIFFRDAEAPRLGPKFEKGASDEGSSLIVKTASAASGINETRLHGDPRIAGVDDNRPRRHPKPVDQEPDNMSLTVSLEESRYRDHGLQTHGIIVVIDPQDIYARSPF